MLSLHKRIPVGMKNLRWLEAISKGTMKDLQLSLRKISGTKYIL